MRSCVISAIFLCAFNAFGENEVIRPEKSSAEKSEKAAQAEIAPLFPKPSYFRTTFNKQSPNVELKPPVRLADYVVVSKLELSLRSYLDAVLANNTDISLQKR